MQQQQAQTIGDEKRTLEPRAKAAAQGPYMCPEMWVQPSATRRAPSEPALRLCLYVPLYVPLRVRMHLFLWACSHGMCIHTVPGVGQYSHEMPDDMGSTALWNKLPKGQSFTKEVWVWVWVWVWVNKSTVCACVRTHPGCTHA